MAGAIDVSKYAHIPVHKAIATKDYATLRKILSGLPRLADPAEIRTETASMAEEENADAISAVIDRRDNVPNRDTPLHLAVKLGDETASEMLMTAGADWSLQNEQGWSALQEAICSKQEAIAKIIVRHYQPLAWAKWRRRLPRLVATMTRMRDFYMEITFHFESSMIPFISRIAPSDTYKIWKRGANLRADMTLAGFDGFRIQRSDQSVLFLGDESEDGKLPPGSLCIISHKDKEITNALDGAGAQASEKEVQQEVADMSKTNIFRPGIDVTEAVLLPQLTWRRHEKSEMVGQWKAKVYEMHNVVVSIKSRKVPGAMTDDEFLNSCNGNETDNDDLNEILTEEERKQLEVALKLDSSEEANEGGDVLARHRHSCYESRDVPIEGVNGCNNEKKGWFSGWRKREHKQEDLKKLAPPRRSISGDGKGGGAVSNSPSRSPIKPARHSVDVVRGDEPHRGRDKKTSSNEGGNRLKDGSHESEYKKGLRPILWLSPSFPLRTEELLPLLDILANKVKAIRRLRELLTTKLPMGTFPVKMIQHALADLDKEGSLTTEEIISEYMIKTYQGLPWAHKRYLKHHLDILCKNDELFCDIDGCYIHPDQKEQRSSRRKRLKRKFRGKREEDVVEEENVAREEVNELSDSQVGFQEEPSHGGLRRGKRQRRRSYVFDDEEEDEAVETRMVVEEMNRQKRSEMVVYETQNLVLLLKGREVECKSCETKNDDHGNVDIAEGKLEPQIDIECTNEVKNQVVQVDHVLSEGRKEPELSVLPANMMNILPVVTEGEVLNLDHSNDANVMLGTVESVTNPLASISNINNDATGSTVKKSLLVDRKSNPSVNELMIVPYVDNLLNSTIGKQMIPVSKSVNPIIVCGLPYKQPMTPKKFQVYRPKKLKPTKENAKALKDELVLASLNSSVQKSLMTKLKWKSQSPKPEGATLLEDVSVHKLQRHKSSHPVSFEIASIEDEEPLRQVMEKCGGWKKHGKQRTMLKVTSEDLASAEAVVQLPDELPSLENFVEKTPTVEKESALSHEKSYDYVGGDASRKSSSSFLEETGTKGSKRPDNQHPVIAQLATGCQRDCANVKHKQEQQTQDSCDLKRLTDNLDLKSKKSQIVGLESLSKEVSSSQCLDWIRGQAKKSELQINDHNSQATTAIILKLGTESVLDGDCPSLIEGSRLQLPNKPSDSKETTVEFPIPLQVEHHEGEEGLSEPTGHGSSGNQHSEQEKPHLLSQLFEYQKEENEGQGLHGIRHEDLKPPVPTFVRQQENKDQVRLFELTEATPENETHKHSDKPKTSQRKKRGRPRKPDQRTMKDATNSLNPQTLTHLSDHQKELAMEDALDPPTSQQHSKQKNKSVKQDAHVRTRKHKTTENDAVEPSDPNLMEQGQLSGAESSQNLQNQDKLPKKGGRKQLRKSKEPPPEAMDLYISYLQEQGLDPATGERLDQENKHLQEDGQEICLKQKEATEDAAILSNMQQKQGHRLDPTSGERLDQENKQLQEGQEVCWKQKEATEDAAILSNMQQKQGLSEPANCQRGRPSKKKKILTEEHLTASLKLNHQTDVGLSEPAKNQQSPRQNKEPRRGRSKIQKEGDKDNEAPRSSSHQELDGQCGGASDHHTGSENSQQRKAQSPEKGATKSGAATPLLQYPEQVELKSSSHVTPEASLKQSQVDLKESVPATSDHIDRANFEMSTLAASETSTCMADQSSQGDKDQSQPRRRTTRSSEAAKKNLDSQNVTHDLVSSDHQYPDKSEDSDIVVHGKPVELEQTELTSDIKSHRQSQKQKQHQQGRLSSSKPVTRLSVSQHDQELSEESHNQAKVEVQVKSPKEMSAKSASIRVPLSSKDQLRSRTKRQSQDSA